MSLFNLFKKRESFENRPEGSNSRQPLTAEELFDQGKALETTAPQKAFNLFLQSAQLGFSKAMNKVGFCYFRQGTGIPYNPKEALFWFKKGAEAGDGGSMMMLSQFYMAGLIVPQDDTMAKRWLKNAISLNDEKLTMTANRYLSDYDGTKAVISAMFATANEMGGLPQKPQQR